MSFERRMKLGLLGLGAILLHVSCGLGGNPQNLGTEHASTTMAVNLPDRSSLKERVGDIESRMNAFQLAVNVIKGDCALPPLASEPKPYSESTKMNIKLDWQCDYSIKLALGNYDFSLSPNSPDGGETFTYENHVKPVIERDCAGCHDSSGQTPGGDFTVYDNVFAKRFAIVQKVIDGSMPKGHSGDYSSREVFQNWANGGYQKVLSTPPQGGQGPSKELNEVYYVNTISVLASEIKGKDSYAPKFPLYYGPDAAKIGLKQSPEDQGPLDQPDSEQRQGDSDDLAPPVPPGDIFDSRLNDLSVVNGAGAKLSGSDLFDSKGYLVVKISATWCGPCKSLMRDLANKTLNNCSNATLLDVTADRGGEPIKKLDSAMSSMVSADKLQDIVSHAFVGDHNRWRQALNVQQQGYPHTIILDRQMNIVEEGNLSAAMIESACR